MSLINRNNKDKGKWGKKHRLNAYVIRQFVALVTGKSEDAIKKQMQRKEYPSDPEGFYSYLWDFMKNETTYTCSKCNEVINKPKGGTLHGPVQRRKRKPQAQ